MKKTIRLTESDLHRIVKESVSRVLNEMNEAISQTDMQTPYDGAKRYVPMTDRGAKAREMRNDLKYAQQIKNRQRPDFQAQYGDNAGYREAEWNKQQKNWANQEQQIRQNVRNMKNGQQPVTESTLKQIVNECVNKVLKNTQNRNIIK